MGCFFNKCSSSSPTEGGIDAKSPDGTAASFSKANRNALIIANTSLFYELATNEIVNSLHT